VLRRAARPWQRARRIGSTDFPLPLTPQTTMPLLASSAVAAAAAAATATTTKAAATATATVAAASGVPRLAVAQACLAASLLSTAATLVASSLAERRPKLVPTSRGVPNIQGFAGVRASALRQGETLCKCCRGRQRVECACCAGKGRVNRPGDAVLPRGEWPSWCPACGGGGLEVCPLCLGEGVKRRFGGF